MYLHILIGVLLLAVCSGDSSNEAVSSVTYHRDDVPLSYKYSNVHAYSTQKPNIGQSKNNFKNIQYAPVVSQVREKPPPETHSQPAGLYTEAIFSKYPKAEGSSNDQNLEPQEQHFGRSNNEREFITGYNIEANLKPRNWNYRNNLNVDYKNNAVVNQEQSKLIMATNSEHLHLTKPTKLSELNKMHILNLRQRQGFPYKSIPVLSMMENEKIHPALNSFVKIPHLHLNVARSYNFARQPPKAPVNEYENILGKHQYSFLPNSDNILTQKTLLYPVVKHV